MTERTRQKQALHQQNKRNGKKIRKEDKPDKSTVYQISRYTGDKWISEYVPGYDVTEKTKDPAGNDIYILHTAPEMLKKALSKDFSRLIIREYYLYFNGGMMHEICKWDKEKEGPVIFEGPYTAETKKLIITALGF